jgi:hypothetical protein
MPVKAVLKVDVIDCSSPGANQIAITDNLTVEAVVKSCCKKRGLDEHLPWWLVVSEAGEDPRSAGIRQPWPLLISEIIDDFTSTGKDTSSIVWTLLLDAAATAEARAAAEAKASRAASKSVAAMPSVPVNFKIVSGILSRIGCTSFFAKFQEEELDDSTLDDLQDEHLVAAGLSEAQAKLFLSEFRGGHQLDSTAAVSPGSPDCLRPVDARSSLDCDGKFKTIAGALSRIGCSAFLQRFVEEEIDDSMLGDLEQEHLIDLGMSVKQYGCIALPKFFC